MKVTIHGNNHILAQREPGDTPIRRESTLFHHVRLALRKMGHDVVRQVPAKDGHLSSAPYYVRERHGKWCAYDNHYAIRDLAETYRKDGECRLDIMGEL